VVYAVLWLAMPIDRNPSAPGIDAATRTGMRTQTSVRSADIGERLALLLLGVGVALLVQFLVPSSQVVPFWPMVVFAVGVALVWRQADSLPADRPPPPDARGGPGAAGHRADRERDRADRLARLRDP
jgi:hypothetical protein